MAAWEGRPPSPGESCRWRTLFSLACRGRPRCSASSTSSPTTSPTSTPPASRPTARCSPSSFRAAPAPSRSPRTTGASSFVQDSMSWHDMSQGTVQQTGGPLDVAIDGDGMLVVQTARGERYTRNGALQLNNHRRARDHRRRQGAGRQRPDRVPADRPRHRHHQGRHHQGPRGRRASTPIPRAASCASCSFANPQQLRKDGARPSRRPTASRREPPRPSATCRAGRDREVERARR